MLVSVDKLQKLWHWYHLIADIMIPLAWKITHVVIVQKQLRSCKLHL